MHGQLDVPIYTFHPVHFTVCSLVVKHHHFWERPEKMVFHGFVSPSEQHFLSCRSWLPTAVVKLEPSLAIVSLLLNIHGMDKRLILPVVANMTAICGMISWTGILWTSIRWHKGLKVHGIDRNTLAYKAPFQPYLSYCECLDLTINTLLTSSDGISVCVMVIIFGGFTSFSKTKPCTPRNYK